MSHELQNFSYMKCGLIFLLCLFGSLTALSQERHPYKYRYVIRGGDFKDSFSFRIDTLNNELDTSIVDVTVRDKIQSEVHATVAFRDVHGNTIERLVGVEKASYRLKPGKYQVTISAVGYSSESISIDVSPKQHIHVDMLMARAGGMDIYDVYSKEKLTKAQLDEIKKCIRENGFGNCARKGKYYITLEI